LAAKGCTTEQREVIGKYNLRKTPKVSVDTKVKAKIYEAVVVGVAVRFPGLLVKLTFMLA
jgi:hypothetical protein